MQMRKQWILWLMLLLCAVSTSAYASTVQIADYMANPAFDNNDISTTGGQTDDLYYQQMPGSNGADGWNVMLGGGYFIRTKDHVNQEDTPEQMALMLTTGAEERMFADVNTTLVDGNTYQVQFKYRSFKMPTEEFGRLDLQVAIGFYDGTLFYTTPVLQASTDEWQTYTYSFTYSAADHVADNWVIAFIGTNPEMGAGQQGRVLIDSLSVVPEPTTLGLMAIGSVLVAIRRRR